MSAELLHNDYFKCNQQVFELFNTVIVVLFILLSSPEEKCIYRYFMQWQIQGRGPGGPGSPLFLDQTELGRGRGGKRRSRMTGSPPEFAEFQIQWKHPMVVGFNHCCLLLTM